MSLYDHSPRVEDRFLTRRQMLQRCGMGMGALALGNLLSDAGLTQAAHGAVNSTNPLAVKNPHFPGKAKRIIHLFMNGGPSHIDIWDPKPDAPANIRGDFKPIKTKIPGTHISETMPMMAEALDKACFDR